MMFVIWRLKIDQNNMRRLAPRNYPDFREDLLFDFTARDSAAFLDESEYAETLTEGGSPGRVNDDSLGGHPVANMSGSDYFAIDHRANLSAVPLTLVMLLRWNDLPSNLGNWTDVFTKRASTDSLYQWGITADNATDEIVGQVVDDANVFHEARSDDVVIPGHWYFLDFLIDSNFVGHLYLDEVLQADTADSVSMHGDGDELRIGYPGYAGTTLDNYIAAARVYGRALTSDEMKQIHDSLRSRFGILPIGVF